MFFKSYHFELTELLAHDLQVCVVKLPVPDVLLAQTLHKGTLVESIPLFLDSSTNFFLAVLLKVWGNSSNVNKIFQR
jgi:hypothetical protein